MYLAHNTFSHLVFFWYFPGWISHLCVTTLYSLNFPTRGKISWETLMVNFEIWRVVYEYDAKSVQSQNYCDRDLSRFVMSIMPAQYCRGSGYLQPYIPVIPNRFEEYMKWQIHFVQFLLTLSKRICVSFILGLVLAFKGLFTTDERGRVIDGNRSISAIGYERAKYLNFNKDCYWDIW